MVCGRALHTAGFSGNGSEREQSELTRLAPDRRTIVVLGSLVFGMTVASSILLALEPGPSAPLPGVTLQQLERVASEDRLFDIPAPLDWRAIVIHDSRSQAGSADSINKIHHELGRGGLGYHFVINNGTEELDGLIEVGYRWQRQIVGDYLEGEGAEWFHKHAIGICIVGDGDQGGFTDDQIRELVWLVQELQSRFHIPKQAVFLQIGSDDPQATSHFPTVSFQSQLLGR